MLNGLRPLIVFDFDMTLADTSAPSPSGMSVETAYRKGIEEIFGSDGIYVYQELLGGLRSREPKELITEILKTAGSEGISLRIGQEYHLNGLTELLVSKKLGYLLAEISPEWPRLTPGADELLMAHTDGKLPVEIGIVSSGHDLFIEKTLETHGFQRPDYMSTSDQIRCLEEPRRPLYKPFPYQLARVHREWFGDGNSNGHNGFRGRERGKPYMMYVGDDPAKDGGLAERSRIPFGFVPFSHPDYKPDPEKGQFLVPDLTMLTETLMENGEQIREGTTFSEVFLRTPDQQLFPALEGQNKPNARWDAEARAHRSKERC